MLSFIVLCSAGRNLFSFVAARILAWRLEQINHDPDRNHDQGSENDVRNGPGYKSLQIDPEAFRSKADFLKKIRSCDVDRGQYDPDYQRHERNLKDGR